MYLETTADKSMRYSSTPNPLAMTDALMRLAGARRSGEQRHQAGAAPGALRHPPLPEHALALGHGGSDFVQGVKRSSGQHQLRPSVRLHHRLRQLRQRLIGVSAGGVPQGFAQT